ncbi:hypothetical protein FXO37_23921 [Capsicum annuum]|nr:hypothetical protein FXO37_23921 [Capsicum annuum]
MKILSTSMYVLTLDMFGPIVDNDGGIVEMSQQLGSFNKLFHIKPKSVREITDVLDVVGNTAKAITKEFELDLQLLYHFFCSMPMWMSGKPLSGHVLERTLEACDKILDLDSLNMTVLDFVESLRKYIALNLCGVVGSAVTMKLMCCAGGLMYWRICLLMLSYLLVQQRRI